MCTKRINPEKRMTTRRPLNFNSRIGQEILQRLKSGIETNGPSTGKQIQEYLNRGKDRTRAILLDFHEAKLIHIWDWATDKDGRFVVPIYIWGPGEDAPRPPRRTNTETHNCLGQPRKSTTTEEKKV